MAEIAESSGPTWRWPSSARKLSDADLARAVDDLFTTNVGNVNTTDRDEFRRSQRDRAQG